jgi:hypothetical protein
MRAEPLRALERIAVGIDALGHPRLLFSERVECHLQESVGRPQATPPQAEHPA